MMKKKTYKKKNQTNPAIFFQEYLHFWVELAGSWWK